MDYLSLKNELVIDPLGRGYAGMTDQQAATSLNTANRSRLQATMQSYILFESVVITEWNALTDANRSEVKDIMSLGTIKVSVGSRGRTRLIAIFGAGSTTISNIQAAITELISRAQELGFGEVHSGDVAHARSL